MNSQDDTIAAVSTPAGVGGIAVIRVSGPDAISIVNSAWKGIDLSKVSSHSAHLGKYYTKGGNLLDEAVATLFIAPASFTGENVVELSVHGSSWIQRELLNDLVKRGARIANPGEFTQRAFLNGKLDLAQAEGVADLISSSSKAAHDMAINQVRGSFSKEFQSLRDKLIEFASLLELELDFSEEDVEFADRRSLLILCNQILDKVNSLASSYSKGAVLKNGVPVAIAGVPNAGKSSLLNLLLGDDKAIVTDIPGTTRDIIEDTIEIDGILYRFIDTAGIRETSDKVEELGVDRAKKTLEKSFITIWMIDGSMSLQPQLNKIKQYLTANKKKNFIILINKSDLLGDHEREIRTIIQNQILDNKLSSETSLNYDSTVIINFSTITSQGLPELLESLNKIVTNNANPERDILVTNARHFEALTRAGDSLQRVKEALESNLSADFIARYIREATAHLATITGTITTDTLLHSIFSRFCVGK